MLASRTDGAIEEEAARLRGAWTAAAVFFLGGCSASTATMECRRAERLLRSAASPSASASFRGSPAPGLAATQGSLAPGLASAHTYELTLARAYLDKAREEASEAHYGSATELARASQRASERARAPGALHYDGTKGQD